MKTFYSFISKSFSLVVLLSLFGTSNLSFGQFVEDFEFPLPTGSTMWTTSGFTFSTGTSNFDTEEFVNAGAGGSDRYLDNFDDAGTNKTYTINITGGATAYTMQSMEVYLSSDPAGANPTNIGTLTIVGKLSGSTVFTEALNGVFPATFGSTNGFYFINFCDLPTNGNVSFDNIDQLELSITGAFQYIAVDNFTFDGPVLPSDPPEVKSITLKGNPNSGDPVIEFDVVFSEPPVNVTPDDFQLVLSGVTANITGVSTTGSTSTVTVSNVSGEGTLKVDLKAGTDIQDASGNSGTPAFSTGEVHHVSRCFVEDFENFTNGASTFASNGVNFTTGSANFSMQEFTNGGAGSSDKFLSNDNDEGIGKMYTISQNSGGSFTADYMALYLSSQTDGLNPTDDGSITVEGLLMGNSVFSINKTSGFPANLSDPLGENGWFLFDFATEETTDYSFDNIDQLKITLGGAFKYIALDDFSHCSEIIAATPPIVQSINLVGNPPASSFTVQYEVKFNENAVNVSTDDFMLITSGTAMGQISTISGSGDTYIITVINVDGEGTIRLDLKGNTDIVDDDGNGPPDPFIFGEVHLVSDCPVETFESLDIEVNSWTTISRSFSTSNANFKVDELENGGAGNSNRFLDNIDDQGTGKVYSIAITDDKTLMMQSMEVYVSSVTDGEDPTNDGTLIVRGKLDGNTVFTNTRSTGFPTDFGGNNGWYFYDFATEGGNDQTSTPIDEIEVEIQTAFQYIALDNFKFCILVGPPPMIGAVTTDTEVCVNDPFTIEATGLMNMAEATNLEEDYGIEFVYFDDATADPYTGGTPLGTVASVNLTDTDQTATLTTATISAADPTGHIYAILSPVPTDVSIRPFAETTFATDAQAPGITCPADIAANNDMGICGANVTIPDPAISDNCPGATFTYSPTSGSLFAGGTTLVTAMVTDAAGTTASCSFNVIVNDTEDPMITCPADITQMVDASCSTIVPDLSIQPATLIAQSSVEFSGIQGQDGWYYGSHSAFDFTGFTQLPNFTGFVWNNPGTILDFPQLDAQGGHPQIENFFWAVRRWESDFTGMVEISGDFFDRDGGCGDGAHVRIFHNGVEVFQFLNVPLNSTLYSFNLNIQAGDLIDFAIDPKFDPGCDDTHFVANIITLTGVMFSDNCGPVTVTQSISAGTPVNPGIHPVTLEATDASSNNNSCSFNLVVVDDTPPEAFCKNITVELDASGQATVLPGDIDNNSTDNCGITASDVNGFPFVLFTCANIGQPNMVQLNVSDASGNSDNCIASINVIDFMLTVGCPSDPAPIEGCTTANVLSESALSFSTDLTTVDEDQFTAEGGTLSEAGATSSITYVDTKTGVGVHPLVVTRTFTITYGCNGSETCTQFFTIQDTQPPTIPTCPPMLTVEGCNADDVDADGQTALSYKTTTTLITSQQFTDEGGTWADNCTPQRMIQYQDEADGTCPITITRTFTVTDFGFNTVQCQQTIEVDDTTPPSITCPDPQTGILDDNCNFTVPNYTGLATNVSDECAGPVPVTQNVGVGMIFNGAGPTVIVLTATDGCGNTTPCNMTLNLLDQIPPTWDEAPDELNRTFDCIDDALEYFNNTVPSASDNCDDMPAVSILSNSDIPATVAERCDFIWTIVYRAEDESGNMTGATQAYPDYTIIITVNDEILPQWTTQQGDLDVTISCFEDIPMTMPVGTDNCGMPFVRFEMETIADLDADGTCNGPDGKNILQIERTFSLTDSCGNQADSEFLQVITIRDDAGPVMETEAMNRSENCTGQSIDELLAGVAVPNPIPTDGTYPPVADNPLDAWIANLAGAGASDCSVAQIMADFTGGGDINFVNQLEELTWSYQLGTIQAGCGNTGSIAVTFTVTDVCGNSNTTTATFSLEDTTPPVVPPTPSPNPEVVQCATEVPAPMDLTAIDNCSGPITVSPTDEITQQICANQYAIIRKWIFEDACQNKDSVEQIILVFDDTPPMITNCPAGIAVECFEDIPAADPLSVSGTDNCGAVNTATVSNIQNNDGIGCPNDPFTRTYTYELTDICDNASTCAQVITVINTEEPTIDVVSDLTVDCFEAINPNPAWAEVTTGCGNSVDYTVIVDGPLEDNEPNNCFGETYTYEYTVTDACSRSASVMQIYHIENDGPTMACPDNCEVFGCYDGNAEAVIQAWINTVTATSSCNDELTVTNDYDGINGVCIDNGFTPVIFTATDDCNPERTATCESLIIIVDDDEPTITQQPQDLLVPCTANTATQFQAWLDNHGGATAYDACGPVTWLDPILSQLLNCDLGPQVIVVEFPVRDECFNMTSVTAVFNTKLLPLSVNVAGLIQTEESEAVAAVEVAAYQSNGMTAMDISNDSGDYGFEELPFEENTEIVPARTGDWLNGISTYDLILLQQHILGVNELNSPYKRIAADANRSGTISTLDLVLLRRLILHIDETLEDNNSWRFVDADFVFPNPADPFATAFPEAYSLSGEEEEWASFVAVKIGDLNLDAETNSLNASGDDRSGLELLKVQTTDQLLKAGQQYEVDLSVANFDAINGFQFTLGFDPGVLDIIEVRSADLAGFDAQNYGLTKVSEGAVTVSWNSSTAKNLSAGEAIFTLFLRAKANIQLSEVLVINSTLTRAEAYQQDELMNVSLAFLESGLEDSFKYFQLFQNQPNPFMDATTISFVLPEAGEVSLEVFDVSGRLVYMERSTFDKGYQQIELDRSQLSVGVFYYKVSASNHAASRRMILLE